MTSHFYPGQEVICLKSWDITRKGRKYTVRNVRVYPDGTYGIDLVENGPIEFFYESKRFKPVSPERR